MILCSWEVNHRFSIAVAMHHRHCGLSTYRLEEIMEMSTPRKPWRSTAPVTFLNGNSNEDLCLYLSNMVNNSVLLYYTANYYLTSIQVMCPVTCIMCIDATTCSGKSAVQVKVSDTSPVASAEVNRVIKMSICIDSTVATLSRSSRHDARKLFFLSTSTSLYTVSGSDSSSAKAPP